MKEGKKSLQQEFYLQIKIKTHETTVPSKNNNNNDTHTHTHTHTQTHTTKIWQNVCYTGSRAVCCTSAWTTLSVPCKQHTFNDSICLRSISFSCCKGLSSSKQPCSYKETATLFRSPVVIWDSPFTTNHQRAAEQCLPEDSSKRTWIFKQRELIQINWRHTQTRVSK